jgi:hypothetical protein
MLLVQALNMMWHGLPSVAWCTFKEPVSQELRASVGKPTGLVDMVDDKSFMRGLALMPSSTSDNHLIACDDTAWQWMVLLLMCSLSYCVLAMMMTLLRL